MPLALVGGVNLVGILCNCSSLAYFSGARFCAAYSLGCLETRWRGFVRSAGYVATAAALVLAVVISVIEDLVLSAGCGWLSLELARFVANPRCGPPVRGCLSLVAARWQRRAGLILLRSGPRGSPFGGEVIVVLPVPCCARRALGLALDGCSRAVIAQAEFLAALVFFSSAYAVAFSLLFLSKAGLGGVGGFLVFGGAWSGFAAGIGGFGLLGTRVAGVSRLEEDEGELESAAYCTCVQTDKGRMLVGNGA